MCIRIYSNNLDEIQRTDEVRGRQIISASLKNLVKITSKEKKPEESTTVLVTHYPFGDDAEYQKG